MPPPPCAQAPGSGILAAYVGSSNTSTAISSGTSMAAPHVSGVAAQLLGADSTLSVARVKEMILAAAEVDYIALSSRAIAAGTPNRFLIGGAGIAGLLNRPKVPPSPPPPPSSPMTTFDFSNGITAGLGWSTGGGVPATYAFSMKREGRTSSSNTGPSAGVGGSGPYVYAETSSPRAQGDLFTLTYDGSVCSNIGLSVSTVRFHYHM